MRKHDSSKNNWVNVKPGGFDVYRDAGDFYLDEAAGQQVIDFFAECLCHVKGEKALQPLVLDLWQQAIVGHLFGWKHQKTHHRRFREALLFLPRKQGKTLVAAGLALYFLFCEPERGQEIYCCAADREQARLLFDAAKAMVVKDEELSKRGEVLRYEIRYKEKDSFFKVISSETAGKHGYNSSLVIIDELHAIQDRELVDVLTTSTGARREPLTVILTTAGYDRHSICFEKYQYACRVRDGIIQDPALLPVIYEADREADWTAPETWRACNPGLGASISIEYLQRECERAQEVPAYEATFKRLHLNIWTEAETPFIRMADWDACADVLPDLAGRPCYGGLDLASTQDLTSFALCFPPEKEEDPYFLLSFNWVPYDTMRERSSRDKVPYFVWHNQGHIQSTPGNAVDYRFVLADIKKLAAKYDVKAILFDRWGAARVAQDLEDEGLEVIAFGQGFKDMSPPTKELLKLVLLFMLT
ncbi:MAG: terminase large subunit [Syntrophomonadaceae bacterium]|nr:terminase large subunit [Syntrophomonadaceae bacterium]